MTKVILFDFDGTIADSFDNFLEIIDVMTAKYKLPVLSRTEISELRNNSAQDIVKRLKIPLYKIPFMARDMKRLQKEQISSLKPCAGIPDVLKSLKNKNVKLGIATSNGHDNVQAFLTNNNLQFFEYLYCDIGMFGKSSGIKKFLKEHKLSKSEVVYVGDEIRDIEAAHKAGVKVASVTWGFNSKEGLLKHSPDFIINSPEELLKLY